jgi:hypothetical protein
MNSEAMSNFALIFDKRDQILHEDSSFSQELGPDQHLDSIRELAETVQALTTDTPLVVYTRS